MRFKEFIRIMENHGFELAHQRGSHRTYKGQVGDRSVLLWSHVTVKATTSRLAPCRR